MPFASKSAVKTEFFFLLAIKQKDGSRIFAISESKRKACENWINDEMKRKRGLHRSLLCIMFVHVIAQDHKSELWNMIQPLLHTSFGVFNACTGITAHLGCSIMVTQCEPRKIGEKRAREISCQVDGDDGRMAANLKPTKRFEIIETEKREDFTQHLVRFLLDPQTNRRRDNLLIPDGEGAKPAVITLFYETRNGDR